MLKTKKRNYMFYIVINLIVQKKYLLNEGILELRPKHLFFVQM